MSWDKLSMADKAEYIRIAVANGVTNLDNIRDAYNSYAKGGYKPRAYARHQSELPEYHGTYTGNANAQYVWVDEAGNPIITSELDNYDTSKRTLYRPSTTSPIYKDNDDRIAASEQGHMDRVNKDEANLQRIKDEVLGGIEELAYNTPILGDALSIKDIGRDLYNKDYLSAGVGTASLVLPSFVSKFGKKIGEEALFYMRDLLYPRETIRAIKEHKYAPLMSKKRKKDYLDNIRNRMQTEVKPFTKDIVDNNVKVRNSRSKSINEPSPDILEALGLKYPNVRLKKRIKKENDIIPLGKYNPANNEITLRTRELGFKQHVFLPTEQILDTGAHEYGHFWSKQYPDVDNLSVFIPPSTYYTPNIHHPDVHIFNPVFKYKPGDWKLSPDEVIAEVFRHKWSSKDASVITKNSPNLQDMSQKVADSFGISNGEATQMLLDMGAYGYSFGGHLKEAGGLIKKI